MKFSLVGIACLALLAQVTPTYTAEAKEQRDPHTLLPANCVAFFAYDGYARHKKAYDQTALANVMKDDLGDLLSHIFQQLIGFACKNALDEDDQKQEAPAGKVRNVVKDPNPWPQFLSFLWEHGVLAGMEVRHKPQDKESPWTYQLSIVFPEGATNKHRHALISLLQMLARGVGGEVQQLQHGRYALWMFAWEGHSVAWWQVGSHLVLTIGTEPVQRALEVVDRRRPNLTSASLYRKVAAFTRYETDMRGFIDLARVIDYLAEPGDHDSLVETLKDRVARKVVLHHLGLVGLKDLTFHLGFEGKFQRSTVAVNVGEAQRRKVWCGY